MPMYDSPLLSWHGFAIGLLDLDAFFASVEQLDHPEWRGKPLIVGSSGPRGVVSTASYEARIFGVHSAMPSAQAQRLCPQALWTRGNFARYREMSQAVMDILVSETPRVEQVSIDEAFFNVTPGRYARENPVAICQRIQARVSELGITCSIGLGTSKTIAKIASERDKPRGLTVIPPGSEASFLSPLPVRALSGIGKAGEARLIAHGIRTLGQLAACDDTSLRTLLGVMGPRLKERAAGREHSEVAPWNAPGETKSVSHERTFSHDLVTHKELRAAVQHVAGLTGARLRKKGLKGSEVTLKLRFDFPHTRTAQRPLTTATDDEHVFGAVALDLLNEIWHEGIPVRLVGVAVSGFGNARPYQLSLFDEDEEHPAETSDKTRSTHSTRDLRNLAVATDAVRAKFGNEAIAYGHDLRLRDQPVPSQGEGHHPKGAQDDNTHAPRGGRHAPRQHRSP